MKTKSFVIGLIATVFLGMLILGGAGIGIYVYLSDSHEKESTSDTESLQAEHNNSSDISMIGIVDMLQSTIGSQSDQDNGTVAGTQTTSNDDLFTNAIEGFENGGSYSYDSDVSITMSMNVPGVQDVSMNMDMSGNGIEDLSTGNEYAKSSYTVQGVTQTSEVYFIESDVYVKTTGEWKKYTEAEAAEQGMAREDEITAVMKSLSSGDAYTSSAGGTVNGEETVAYTVKLEDALLDEFTSTFMNAFEQSSGGMKPSNFNAQGGTLTFWVGKTSQRVLKAEIVIPSMTFTVTYEGVSLNMELKDLSVTTNYKDWGKKVSLQAPI